MAAWEPLGRVWTYTGPQDASRVLLSDTGCRGLLGGPRGKEVVEVKFRRKQLPAGLIGMGTAGAQKGR